MELPGQQTAHAIETLAEEELPDDIIEMLCHVALEDPSPESDDSSWGIRSHRPSTQGGVLPQRPFLGCYSPTGAAGAH